METIFDHNPTKSELKDLIYFEGKVPLETLDFEGLKTALKTVCWKSCLT